MDSGATAVHFRKSFFQSDGYRFSPSAERFSEDGLRRRMERKLLLHQTDAAHRNPPPQLLPPSPPPPPTPPSATPAHPLQPSHTHHSQHHRDHHCHHYNSRHRATSSGSGSSFPSSLIAPKHTRDVGVAPASSSSPVAATTTITTARAATEAATNIFTSNSTSTSNNNSSTSTLLLTQHHHNRHNCQQDTITTTTATNQRGTMKKGNPESGHAGTALSRNASVNKAQGHDRRLRRSDSVSATADSAGSSSRQTTPKPNINAATTTTTTTPSAVSTVPASTDKGSGNASGSSNANAANLSRSSSNASHGRRRRRRRGSSLHDSHSSGGLQRAPSGRKRGGPPPGHIDLPTSSNPTSDSQHQAFHSQDPPQQTRPQQQHQHRRQRSHQKQRQQQQQQQRQEHQPHPPYRSSSNPPFLPAHASLAAEDPSFPSPNLYDLVLQLNQEPGLESWWQHAVSVLHRHYRAERATLTVPGDSTDLENVPWGQKATYYSAQVQTASTRRHRDVDGSSCHPGGNRPGAAALAGLGIDVQGQSSAGFPDADVNSSNDVFGFHQGSGHSQAPVSRPDSQHQAIPEESKRAEDSGSEDAAQSDAPTESTVSPTSTAKTKRHERQHVHKGPYALVFPMQRELEIESDPLIKRVGVVKLLGRTSPIVLTREYTNDPSQQSEINDDGDEAMQMHPPMAIDLNQATPLAEPTSSPFETEVRPFSSMLTPKPTRNSSLSTILSTATDITVVPSNNNRNNKDNKENKADVNDGSHAQKLSALPGHVLRDADSCPSPEPYEDYEQPLPSPWSQSPAPSPAPLPDENQNPFFLNPHKVDESAFASSPSPTHDYSGINPVPAIGTESCKTIIHIPLLHACSCKRPVDTIRFPVAIISVLTPVVPYPQNLRQSLSFLQPHLTTSFCLASQYSKLEKQLSASSQQRLGHILGLGGTFSDASSELELVAELSGQAQQSLGDEASRSSISAITNSIVAANNANASAAAASTAAANRPDDTAASEASEEATPKVGAAPLPIEVTQEDVDLPPPYEHQPQNQQQQENSQRESVGGCLGSIPTDTMQKAGKDTSESFLDLRKSSIVSAMSLAPTTASPHRPRDLHHRRSSSTNNASTIDKANPQVYSSTQNNSGRCDEATYTKDGSGFGGANSFGTSRLSLPVANSRHTSSSSISTVPRDVYTRPFPDTVAQLILNSVPLHLFLAKPKSGEVIWTNAKFDAYRGGQQEQRLRDPFMNVHEEDRKVLEAKWADALKQGPQGTVPCRVRSCQSDAGYRHFIFRANPLLSSTGEALYWIGSFLDVHDQRLRELEALAERERLQADAKYRAFTNSIPQIVFEAGDRKGLISVNDQWQLYTGQSVDDALNLGFTKFIHPDDFQWGSMNAARKATPDQEGMPTLLEYLTAASAGARTENSNVDFNTDESSPSHRLLNLSNGEKKRLFSRGITSLMKDVLDTGLVKMQKDENGRDCYITEVRLRSRLGEFRWHLVRLVKVDSFGHGEASWYGTCTDINDHKILEHSFNTAMQKLNIEMESKTKFFSNMSHEIRTPLNGILGTIPFLLDTQLDNEQRRMLDTIHNSSMNLRELVDNILDVSKVEAGKMNLVQQWFHLRSVLEDVMDTIGSRAIDRGLELNYLVDADVPSMIIGDRFRIRQILINLVGNAVKFTSQGEIYTHCSIYRDANVKLDESEIFINFDVVDTGKGFSKEEAKMLMERFSQAQGSVGSQQGGTGLGLFLSKQLVEMHGGRLTPWSEGKGAKFSFYVKVGAPSLSPVPENMASRMPAGCSDRPETSLSDASTVVDTDDIVPASSIGSSSRPPNIADEAKSVAPKAAATPAKPKSTASSSPAKKDVTFDPDNDEHPTPALYAQRRKQVAFDPKVTVIPPDEKEPKETLKVYNILIICPLEYARKAVKEHIEQVIPYDVPSKVKSVPEVEDWKEMTGPDKDELTHIVLSLQNTNDMKEVIQCLCQVDVAKPIPILVVVSDLYKRRELTPQLKDLQGLGRDIFVIPKPVKPSSFSPIFDPENKRDLSKDRNQDMVRAVNNNFRTMSRIVKEVIGNKGFRILLVEDDATNLGIMQRYLNKVRLVADTASNGQECLDRVFSKDPGYYSLIICDIQMPVKDGYDTCREIRAWEAKHHFPQIPIMALSANAMHDQIDGAAKAGFNDYLTKPIKHNEFGKHMMELLSGNGPAPCFLKERCAKH